jgi:mannosyltransferase OCH1-like enzyme
MNKNAFLKNRSGTMPLIPVTGETPKPIIGNAPTEKTDNPVVIASQLEFFKRALYSSNYSKEHLERVMSFRGASKWDAAKKAKMVRRLMTANNQRSSALDLHIVSSNSCLLHRPLRSVHDLLNL